jgi:hypothetical protein
MDDDDIGFLPDVGVGEGASTEQRALLVSFETLPENVGRRRNLATEAQARGNMLAMRQAYMHSDLATEPLEK